MDEDSVGKDIMGEDIRNDTNDDSDLEQNPYESPVDRQRASPPIPRQSPISRKEMSGIVLVCAAGALLTACAVGFGIGTLITAIWAPAIVFVVVTSWTFVAASRESKLPFARRLATGVLLTLALPPAAFYLLFVTCATSTEVLGVGFRIHGGGGLKDHFMLALVTFGLTLGIALVIYKLLSFPFRRHNLMNGEEKGDSADE